MPLLALGLAAWLAGPALAHLPHDPMSAIALAPGSGGSHLVAQYLYPGRPLVLVSEDAGRSWGYVAPAGMTHEFTDLRFTDSGVLFAADMASATLFVSHDGGWSWEATAEVDGDVVECFQSSPAYGVSPTLFAGTAAGLWQSDDGGQSWVARDELPAANVVDIALAPAYPDDPTLFVIAGSSEVYRSTDGGGTWEIVIPVQPSIEPRVVAIAPDFELDRMWVGTAGGSVLLSDDRGESWVEVTPQLGPGQPLEEPVQDILPLSANQVLAVASDHAVLCSYNGGTTWFLCNDGVAPTVAQSSPVWGHYSMLRSPSPETAPVAYSAYEGVYVSQDDGQSWSERCTILPTYVRAMHVSPGYPDDPTIWLGSYGSGIYRTVDGGETFDVLADQQQRLFAEWMNIAPEYPDDPRMFAILSRHMLRSPDAGESWEEIASPITDHLAQIHLAPDFRTSGVAYALGTDADVRWMMVRSEDGGLTWHQVYLDPTPEGPQIAHFVFSPTDEDVIYAGRDLPAAVMRSEDRAASWQVLFDLPDAQRYRGVFAIESGGEDVVVAVSDGGRVWQRAGEEGEWLEQGGVEAEVHLARQFGGQMADADGEPGSAIYLSLESPGLARSRDAGANWEILPTPFGATVLAVAVPPGRPMDEALLVSTHYGAFFSCDDGENWHLIDRLLRHEDFSCSVRYEGEDWLHVQGHGTGMVSTISSEAGDSAQVEFFGRGVRWLASRGPDRGSAAVWIDGDHVDDVDLDANQASTTEVVFEYEFVGDDDFHTFRIELNGDGTVDLDAVEVIRHRIENVPDETYEIDDWCIDLTPTDDDDDATADDDSTDDDTTPEDDDSAADDDSSGPAPEGCCAESCEQGAGATPGIAVPVLLGVLLLLRAGRRGI